MQAEQALDGRIGCAVWLVILKGLDGNSIFLQICNLYVIQFHILSCSSWLQFARVLILSWAPVNCVNTTCNHNTSTSPWHVNKLLFSTGQCREGCNCSFMLCSLFCYSWTCGQVSLATISRARLYL